jgi:hypothetical protein
MFAYNPALNPTGPQASAFPAHERHVAEELWVYNGRISVPPVDADGEPISETKLLQRHGCVKITTGRDGTRIRWAVFASNWASLYFAMEFLSVSPGPYILNYYLAGWFFEEIATVAEARARIGVIMGKSDIHLQKRTFVKEVTPTPERMPELLRDALHNRTAIPEVTVDVAYDELSGCFQVGRIGSRSLIARYYGLNPVSYPCQSFHTYHHLVSQAYLKVLKGDEPHYDHVLAAFQMPDSSVLWFPYQRVILPTRLPHGGKGVSVIAEAAKVDITLV